MNLRAGQAVERLKLETKIYCTICNHQNTSDVQLQIELFKAFSLEVSLIGLTWPDIQPSAVPSGGSGSLPPGGCVALSEKQGFKSWVLSGLFDAVCCFFGGIDSCTFRTL